jgi:hypothetical protein
MKTDIPTIADRCFRLSVRHDTWQSLGFRRRPARIGIFRLTKPRWKIAFENRVCREMLTIFSAAHIEAFRTDRENLLRQLVRFYWDDRSGSVSPMFQSKDACLNAIQQYVAAPITKWPDIFVERINLVSVPESKLKQLILGRCGMFVCGVGETILSFRRNLDLTI